MTHLDWLESVDPRVRTWMLMVLIGSTGGLGDLCIERWARTDSGRWGLLSALVWATSLCLQAWLLSNDSRSLGRLLVMITVTHVLLVVIVESLYHRVLPSGQEALGMLVGLLAIVLLEWQAPQVIVEPPPAIPAVESASVQTGSTAPASGRPE